MPYDLANLQLHYSDNVLQGNTASDFPVQNSYNCLYQYPYTVYPSYIYVDKTKKAIEVLRALEAKKLIKFESVNKFLELIDEISKLV